MSKKDAAKAKWRIAACAVERADEVGMYWAGVIVLETVDRKEEAIFPWVEELCDPTSEDHKECNRHDPEEELENPGHFHTHIHYGDTNSPYRKLPIYFWNEINEWIELTLTAMYADGEGHMIEEGEEG